MPRGTGRAGGLWPAARRGLATALGEGVAALWAAAERLADVAVWLIRRGGLAPAANVDRRGRRRRTEVSPPDEDG